jgi:two-component system, chemotaxis family, sensor kinase CheA
MVSLDQFRETYLTECSELLSDMEGRLISLSPDTADNETLNAIFRCAHSIKGGAGAFGLDYIANFTHVLEALLDAMREGKVQPIRETVDILLKATDIVVTMVQFAKDAEIPPADLGQDVLKELQRLAGIGTPAKAEQNKTLDTVKPASHKRWQINFAPHENLFDTGNEPILILRELSRLGECKVTAYTHRVPSLESLNPSACYLGWSITITTEKPESLIREAFEFVTDHCDLTLSEVHDAEITASITDTKPRAVAITPQEDASIKSIQSTSIRVDIDKIDRLVNMVGELVITEAMLRAQTRSMALDEFQGLLRGVDELSQHTRELQEAVMSVRMQPVKSIFSRMPRIVRDLSGQLGKDIKLEMFGENTEVDKTVIEQLGDPLTHMIRNSVDHGIEKPEIRLQNGKPAQGTIQLSADHRGGHIIIEIRDDGAGINRTKVLSKAKEKGLIAPDATLTDEECDNLIFMAGFSTAEVVSNVSGRGVGMDVVKRNIEGMGGTVKVTTEPGKGSRFIVSLPLTLAILDGMIVRVGNEHYIIPITSIIETLRPRADAVSHVEGHSDVINVRGEFVSIVYLSRIFKIANAESDPSKALIVLVESGNEKLGLMVDELIGQQQVVIKSLEANTDPVKGISGATILGDGRVSLILEINELKQLPEVKAAKQTLATAA